MLACCTSARSRGELAQALAAIDRNASSRRSIVEDVLDVSRIASERLRLESATLDRTADDRRQTRSVQWSRGEREGRRRQVGLGPGPGTVLGDPARLQQIIWNLMTNAVKFTPRGGMIEWHLQRGRRDVELPSPTPASESLLTVISAAPLRALPPGRSRDDARARRLAGWPRDRAAHRRNARRDD